MRILTFLLFFFFSLGISIHAVQAQEIPTPTYEKGTVLEILEEEKIIIEGQEFYIQTVKVESADGSTQEITVGSQFQPLNSSQKVAKGAQVVLAEQPTQDGSQLVIADIYRIGILSGLFILFAVVVFAVSGWQGIRSLIGMAVSLGVILLYIVPNILAGHSPVAIALAGCALIAGTTVYLSHGFTKKSHIALAAMMLTLMLVALVSVITVKMAQLVGLGSEEAYFLQFGTGKQINLQGLLLGGIMLGALGVLDDICVSQVSTIFQLRKANKKLPFLELFKSGMQVGKDHVASLVNTLVLAYAGANLPLFLLFVLSEGVPAWVHLNNELVAEEVVRTLAGSIGLVVAVPIATLAASYFAVNTNVKDIADNHGHTH